MGPLRSIINKENKKVKYTQYKYIFHVLMSIKLAMLSFSVYVSDRGLSKFSTAQHSTTGAVVNRSKLSSS